MKHGQKIFEKKLASSAAARRAQLRNQVSSLILHGKIETTLPKAKVLRHEADKLIELAKRGTDQAIVKIKKSLFMLDETLPRLNLLASRFTERRGGYTRILKNGHRQQGTDLAPLAIVEYLDNPNDTFALLGAKHLPKLNTDLVNVQQQRYQITPLVQPGQVLVDPVTGNPVEINAKQDLSFMKITPRSNLTSMQTRQLIRSEERLFKLTNRMSKSMESLPKAKLWESQALDGMILEMERRDSERLERMQEKLDSIGDAGEREALVKVWESRVFSDTPLACRRVAEKEGKVKRVKVDAEGSLYWYREPVKVEEGKVEVGKKRGEAEVKVEGEKSGKKEGGFGLSRLMRGLGLGGSSASSSSSSKSV
ncbi:hypothetical protein HDU76_006693 [Blyttiomyces sp. JEL0837]|nr:hypothetical protein HDU76_006693 [Blyttiomyces sp. JEL0837]